MNLKDNTLVFPRALLCLFGTLAQGYSFGFGNHTFLLSMIRYHQGYNLLNNDLILDILPAYTTYFYKFLSFIPVNLKGLEIIFLILYLISIYFFYHAMIKLFDLLGNNPVASLLGGIAISIGVIPLLGLSPWQFKLDHGAPGLAIAAWALYCYVSNRQVLAFTLLGLGFNVHALYSAHLFILFSIHMLAGIRENSKVFIVKTVGGFLLFASPVMIWKFASMADKDILDADWINIIHMRLSSQVFFSDYPIKEIIHFVVFLCVILIICRKMIFNCDGTSPYSKMIILFAEILLLCFAQIVFTDYFPLRFALEGQFWRASQWLAMIGIFLIIHGLLATEHSDSRKWMPLIAMGLAVSFVLTNTVIGLVIALATSLLLEKFKTSTAYLLLVVSLVLLHAGMVFGELILKGAPIILHNLRYPGGNPATYMIALAGTAWFLLFNMKWHKLSGAGFFVIILAYAFINQPAYKSINSHRDDPWKEVQSWAKYCTPADSIFITPPSVFGFRVFSDRAIIGEIKDGGMVNNSKKFALEWAHRMKLLGVENICSNNRGHPEYQHCLVSRYSTLNSKDFREINRKYKANYVVTSLDHSLPFPLIWKNDKYRVFEINRSAK